MTSRSTQGSHHQEPGRSGQAGCCCQPGLPPLQSGANHAPPSRRFQPVEELGDQSGRWCGAYMARLAKEAHQLAITSQFRPTAQAGGDMGHDPGVGVGIIIHDLSQQMSDLLTTLGKGCGPVPRVRPTDPHGVGTPCSSGGIGKSNSRSFLRPRWARTLAVATVIPSSAATCSWGHS